MRLLRVAAVLLFLGSMPFEMAVAAVFVLQACVISYYMAKPLKSYRRVVELKKEAEQDPR